MTLSPKGKAIMILFAGVIAALVVAGQVVALQNNGMRERIEVLRNRPAVIATAKQPAVTDDKPGEQNEGFFLPGAEANAFLSFRNHVFGAFYDLAVEDLDVRQVVRTEDDHVSRMRMSITAWLRAQDLEKALERLETREPLVLIDSFALSSADKADPAGFTGDGRLKLEIRLSGFVRGG